MMVFVVVMVMVFLSGFVLCGGFWTDALRNVIRGVDNARASQGSPLVIATLYGAHHAALHDPSRID
jgi:hypothetical protein